MSYQVISNARVEDAEIALIERYGSYNVKPLIKSEYQAEWLVRITNKLYMKCRVSKAGDGISISLSPYTHWLIYVLIVVGFLFFALPGFAFLVYLVVRIVLTNGVINRHFPVLHQKIIESVNKRVS